MHPKAMPVILIEPTESETWLTAPWTEAHALQRPLPDGSLRIVLRGVGSLRTPARLECPSGPASAGARRRPRSPR